MVLEFEIFYHHGCPNYTKACEIICDFVGENEKFADIKLIPVLDNKDAGLFRFKGSPTVKLNGVDVEDCYYKLAKNQQLLIGSLYEKNACRLYDCKESKGCPSKEMIECVVNSMEQPQKV
ncbi:MAG: hypothetical protein HeimC2_21910 [Candidatus Heimdallarchaeota archaeon LC_2]|nr:MAG: hypothetical protein HeimC2_21910 [Candidatus Heimdallarchaeota archaeon LC_2]